MQQMRIRDTSLGSKRWAAKALRRTGRCPGRLLKLSERLGLIVIVAGGMALAAN